MSRVGRAPITVPAGVSIAIQGNHIVAKGKLGELDHDLPGGITASLSGNSLQINRLDDSRSQKSLHGLSRTLIANMVQGVSEGFKKDLEIVGVGFRCEAKGNALMLQVGFSHRVIILPPEGIKFSLTNPTNFSVSGIDKQLVGEVAAKIRAVKPPEPFRGKGIKYVGEVVRRKAGKSAGK